MRRIRVTSAMQKALARQRDRKGNLQRGGVMVVPVIASVEAWDALAVSQQARLLAHAREGMTVPVAIEAVPDPMDVTHRYRTAVRR